MIHPSSDKMLVQSWIGSRIVPFWFGVSHRDLSFALQNAQSWDKLLSWFLSLSVLDGNRNNPYLNAILWDVCFSCPCRGWCLKNRYKILEGEAYYLLFLSVESQDGSGWKGTSRPNLLPWAGLQPTRSGCHRAPSNWALSASRDLLRDCPQPRGDHDNTPTHIFQAFWNSCCWRHEKNSQMTPKDIPRWCQWW